MAVLSAVRRVKVSTSRRWRPSPHAGEAMTRTIKPLGPFRGKLHEVIFEADTPAGRLFDVLLIWAIMLSVVAVMLDSVAHIRAQYGQFLMAVEWFFTILFTVEYIMRLSCIGRPTRYATSFFGLVDLLAILPTYLSVLLPGTQYLLVIRILRVLRLFRVLKLAQFISEGNSLMTAVRASRIISQTQKFLLSLFHCR